MRDIVWQVATVVDAEVDRIRVSFDSLSTCQRCLAGEGCGAGVFTRLFARRRANLVVQGEHDFVIGDKLRIGVAGNHLALSALALYGLPLLGFLAGALAGHWWAGDSASRDFMALLFGLALGLAASRLFNLGPGLLLKPSIERFSCTNSGLALESKAE